MKNTKEKFLNIALELFNTLGLSKVTLRSIANEMGISQGNLNYHFRKREDIIETLYFQLVSNNDASMINTEKSNNILQLVFCILETIMLNFYNYRFFLLDFVQIIRENKKIKVHYSALSLQRGNQFLVFFNLLVKTDLRKKEILPNEYQNLYKRFQILGDFWISDAENFSSKISKKQFRFIPKY